MQWSKKPCAYLKTALRQVQMGEQTQELRLPEHMPDIGRIVCAWGQSTVRSKELRGENIVVSGGISTQVLYLPEDGTEAQTLQLWLPFQMKWSLPQPQREATLRTQCLLKSVDARILSSRKMMVKASFGVSVEMLENEQAMICSAQEQIEGVELLTNTYPTMLPTQAGEKQLQIEQELHLPEAKQWISWSISPQITEKSIVGNRVILRGSVQAHYVYLDGQNTVCSGREDIPLAQFIDLAGEYDKQADVDLLLAVSSLETETVEQGVRLQCGVLAQYVVWEQALLEVVEDAYSPCRSVELSREELVIPMQLERRAERFTAATQFQEGKVLDVTFWPQHPVQFREGGQAQIALSGTFQILYEDMHAELQTLSESWTEEISLPLAVDAQLMTNIDCIVCQSGGKQVQLELDIQCRADQSISMLTGVTAGQLQPPDENRPTLILRRMDSESLWKLAKENGSTVGAIRRANGLAQEPEQGQMLIIPIA